MIASETPRDPPERSWFCRGCQKATRGKWVPAGWYTIQRSAGGAGRHLRLGMYCSLMCLADPGLEVLEAGQREHATRLGLPADPVRDRARIVDLATTYLSKGWSVRQIGDTLDVQTAVLNGWLREAGTVVVRGTLTGEVPPPTPPSTQPRKDGEVSPASKLGVRSVAEILATSTPALPRNPVSLLNELAQAGHVQDVTWSVKATSAPHAAQEHTARVSARSADGTPLAGNGTAPGKADARAAAAIDLMASL